MSTDLPSDADVKTVSAITAIPKILEALASFTGMRFAAVARVTETRWTACAVLDEINFGLVPGGELELSTTICDEIRGHHAPVVFPDALADERFRDHHTPRLYGLRSYLSVPIFRADGSFFGTLCAIDPEPQTFDVAAAMRTAQLFAELIGIQLSVEHEAGVNRAALLAALGAATARQVSIVGVREQLNTHLQDISVETYLLKQVDGLSDEARQHVRAIESSAFAMTSVVGGLSDRGGRISGVLRKTRLSGGTLADALAAAISRAGTSKSGRMLLSSVDISCDVHCDAAAVSEACEILVRMALEAGAADRPVEVEARSAADELTFRVLFHSVDGARIAEDALFVAELIAQEHGGNLRQERIGQATRLTLAVPCAVEADELAAEVADP